MRPEPLSCKNNSSLSQEKNIELVKVILSKGEEAECLEVLCQILDQLLDDCRYLIPLYSDYESFVTSKYMDKTIFEQTIYCKIWKSPFQATILPNWSLSFQKSSQKNLLFVCYTMSLTQGGIYMIVDTRSTKCEILFRYSNEPTWNQTSTCSCRMSRTLSGVCYLRISIPQNHLSLCQIFGNRVHVNSRLN